MELSALGDTEEEALVFLWDMLDAEASYWLHAVTDDKLSKDVPAAAYPKIQKLVTLLKYAKPVDKGIDALAEKPAISKVGTLGSRLKTIRNIALLLLFLIVAFGLGVESTPAAPDYAKFMIFPDTKWLVREYYVEAGRGYEEEILKHCGGTRGTSGVLFP